MAMPSSRELARERRRARCGRAAQRIEVGDLRADVRVQADDLEPVARGRARGRCRATSSMAMPNLLALRPGGDVRMAPRVDVGVDAQRDARARLPLARQRVDALELACRLGVDGPDAEVDRLRQLGRASCRRR